MYWPFVSVQSQPLWRRAPAVDDYIVDILLNQFVLSEEQAEEVRWKAEEEGKSIVQVLEELEIMTEDDVLQTLAVEYNMDTFDLHDYRIPSEVLAKVPAEVARKYKIVPVMIHDATVTIAIPDPIKGVEILDSLSYIIHTDVEAVVVKRDQIEKAINTYYGSSEEAVDSILAEVTEGEIDVQLSEGGLPSAETMDIGDDSPIIKLVALIITKAYQSRASDIHLGEIREAP